MLRSLFPHQTRSGDDPSEDGYTVLESVVAVAILVSVLVPAIGGLAHIVGTETARREIVALSRAQQAMETALRMQRPTDRTWTTASQRWLLRRSIETDDDLATITIRIWRFRPADQDADRSPGRSSSRRAASDVPDRTPFLTLTTARIDASRSP